MTTLRDLLDDDSREPTIDLKLAGKSAPQVLRARVAAAYGSDGIASGAVVLRSPPVEPAQGQSIAWRWGFNGLHIPGFTGYVVDVAKLSYPDSWQLSVRDVLWLASREQRAIQTSPLNSITANAAIAQILAAAGVTRLALPTIPRPSGGTWTLGTLTPVSWSQTTALAAAQEIAKTAGYTLYADAGGTVRGAAIERRPSFSAAWTFLDGRDFLEDAPPQRTRDGSQVRNRVTVRGANTGVQGAQLFDTFSAPHALYSGVVAAEEQTFTLLEDIADVTAVASRLTGLLNRRPDTIRFGCLFNPYLSIAQTIGIRDPYIGLSSTKTYFVYGLDTEVDYETGRARCSVTADGGLGNAGYSLIPAPTAVITYTLERETVDGTAVVVIDVDGSGSISNSEGEIVAWQWSMADAPYDGTASGSTSPHASPRFTFVTAASNAPFSITLTVTDTSSKTDTVTLEIPLAGDVVQATDEAVHAAAGSAWAYTPDGGATWADEVRTTTVTAEGAGVRPDAPLGDVETYGALAVSGAEVRRTLDGLGATSELLNTAGGSVTALHVNALDGARVWRAVGATIQRSLDGGTTWATTGTAPGSVRQIIEDPALDDSIFVLSGANVYNSTSGGASWATLYAGPSGATARWMERSDDGAITWVCYEGTFVGSPLHRIEGPITVAWPLDTSPEVTEIRAIALTKEDAPRIVAVDGQGRTWWADGLTGLSVTEGPALPAGGVAQHATASRAVPSLVYLADFGSVTASTTGALRKLLLNSGAGALLPWRLGPAGRQYHMVSLASGGTAVRGRVYVPTYGQSPGGVWEYNEGTWTLRNTGLPAGIYWYWIASHPFNPGHLLIFGNSSASVTFATSGGELKRADGGPIAYRSVDAGLTWEAIALTTGLSGTYNVSEANLTSGTIGEWLLVAAGVPSPAWRIAPTGTSFASISLATDYETAAGGVGGEYILDHPGASIAYLATDDTETYPAGSTIPSISALIKSPDVSSRALIALTGSGVYRTGDYRDAQPTLALSGSVGAYGAALADGTLLSGSASGVLATADAFAGSGLTSEVVALAGVSVVNVRTDAQTRTLAAALTATQIAIRDSTGRWGVVDLPVGVTPGSGIEIVGKAL